MAGKIIEYDVITIGGEDEWALEKFKQEVNGKITAGWQPVGGIQSEITIVEPNGVLGKLSGKKPFVTYTQAVVRYEKVIPSGYGESDYGEHPLQSDLWDISRKLDEMNGYLESMS
jgi:hypothetical protein